jgi:hypothetical protein
MVYYVRPQRGQMKKLSNTYLLWVRSCLGLTWEVSAQRASPGSASEMARLGLFPS